jgi:predicted PurR-regulated permease PerM
MKSSLSISAPDESRPEAAGLKARPRSLDDGLLRLTKAAEILAIILGGIAFAYFARSIVLPLLLAWVAAMTLKPPVTWLRAVHVPASLAAAMVLGVFLFGAGWGGLWLGRPAVAWVKSAPEKIPQLKDKYKYVLQPLVHFSTTAMSMANLDVAQNPTNAAVPVTVKNNQTLGNMFTWTGGLLGGVSAAIVLTYLLLASGDSFMHKLANALSEPQHKKRAVAISKEIQQSISRYLFTVSIINAGLGCVLGTIFWLLGLPNAAMWGGVVAILNYLPFFGPAMGMVAVGLAGLFAFNTLSEALVPVGAYLLMHLLDSYLITPFVLGRRFALNWVVMFVAFMFCAWLWGVCGALLAVPLLVSLKVVCARLPMLMPIKEFLSP